MLLSAPHLQPLGSDDLTNPFLREIREQPQVIAACAANFTGDGLDELRRELQTGAFDRVVMTGMGSSLYSCHPLLLTLSAELDLPCTVWDASELVSFGMHQLTGRTLFIAVSQSGESGELQHIARLQRPARVVSVTNGSDNTLARWADISLCTQAGAEKAVSAKTYTGGLAFLHLLGLHLTGGDVDAGRTALSRLAGDVEGLLARFEQELPRLPADPTTLGFLAFIGRGPSLASALTGSLITQEATKMPCAGYSGGGFRHGPLELARPGFNAVIFDGSGTAQTQSRTMAAQLAGIGASVTLITTAPPADRDGISHWAIPATAPALLPIAEIIPVQLMTVWLAQSRGYDPSEFEHGSKVTGEG